MSTEGGWRVASLTDIGVLLDAEAGRREGARRDDAKARGWALFGVAPR